MLRALIDFTLSNARRFYSSIGNSLDGKGLSIFNMFRITKESTTGAYFCHINGLINMTKTLTQNNYGLTAPVKETNNKTVFSKFAIFE